VGDSARQLVVEHLVLALGASAAGLAIGYAALASPERHRPRDSSALTGHQSGRHRRGLYGVAAAAIGRRAPDVFPVLTMLGANVLAVLREKDGPATTGRGAQSLRRTLVVTQVGLRVRAADRAGLLFATFRKVLAVGSWVRHHRRPHGESLAALLAGTGTVRRIRRFTDEALRRLRGCYRASPSVAPPTVFRSATMPARDAHSRGRVHSAKGESLIAPSAHQRCRRDTSKRNRRETRWPAAVFSDRDTESAPRVSSSSTIVSRDASGPNQDFRFGRRMYKPGDTTGDPTAITAEDRNSSPSSASCPR
jgi:hypothetical protein